MRKKRSIVTVKAGREAFLELIRNSDELVVNADEKYNNCLYT